MVGRSLFLRRLRCACYAVTVAAQYHIQVCLHLSIDIDVPQLCSLPESLTAVEFDVCCRETMAQSRLTTRRMVNRLAVVGRQTPAAVGLQEGVGRLRPLPPPQLPRCPAMKASKCFLLRQTCQWHEWVGG